MDTADVIVVGGGPAGSSCAAPLVAAGLDVVVIDRASFPRDKVCAGWITPAVVARLGIDVDAYGERLTLQPFTGFDVGTLAGPRHRIDFGEVVSFGIRRCEFDDWLLDRSGARVVTAPVRSIERTARRWVVNGAIAAPVIVGAGGHFCPVARHLNPDAGHERAVVAQEIEFPQDDGDAGDAGVEATRPQLYAWPDLLGYGWAVRKRRHLNLGAGRLQSGAFPARVREFRRVLESRGLLSAAAQGAWRGHAYLVNLTSRRRVSGDGALLVGDAAGLALAPAGEGILSAVESGQIAADVILRGRRARAGTSARPYADIIDARFGRPSPAGGDRAPAWPAWAVRIASRVLFGLPWVTRRVVIERAFLHRHRSVA